MKIYHQLGHNHKWALDSYFQNDIGDGFIFSAFSFKYGKLENGASTYKPDQYLSKSMVDLQFYGSKKTVGGQLESYPFHPVNLNDSDSTMVAGTELIEKAIAYQESLGLRNIIIPVFYHEASDFGKYEKYLKKINKIIVRRKNKGSKSKYLMTVPFSNIAILNDDYVEDLLQATTDMPIVFDGYYVVCDSKPEYKQKVSIDYGYYANLIKVFQVLKNQEFITVFGYSNWDALIFASLCDIDYITIGTYENLRNFNIQRFTESPRGGKSEGWYFSEKLLNFVRAQEIKKLRSNNCLDLIANDKNIFSEIILNKDYAWNTHKPDVHKNYLLAISRLLEEVASIASLSQRAVFVEKKIDQARQLYGELASHRVFLYDESCDYHLGAWDSIIKMHATR
jgi:hypothetical protein